MIDLADRCSKKVYRDSYQGHICERKGWLEYQGEKYCKQHYPPNVAATDKARQEQQDKERQERREAREAAAFVRAELERKAAAYDRLMTCLDAGGGGMGRIREILEGDK